MASPRRRDDRPNFSAKSSHFVKLIAADHTTEIEKLRIPRKFVKVYGNALSDLVFLKVPSGQLWQIGTMRNDGKVWLQNGWKQFAEYYSLKYGDLLVFRYEGNSNFFVRIFNMSASEIDYPLGDIPNEVPDMAVKMEECDDQDDVSIEILDEFSPHSRSHKRSRPNSTGKTNSGANQHPSASHFNVESTRSEGMKLEKSKRKPYQSKQDFHESRLDHGSMKRFTSDEKASSHSKMKNPSFEVEMRPSYIHKGLQLGIPRKFSKRYLTERNGDVILSVADGRTWSAKYYFNLDNKTRGAALYCGWRAFVKDNSLKVGDACVFELLESTKEVVIFRVTREAKCPLSQAKEIAANRAKPKRSMEPKMEASEDDISFDTLDDCSPCWRQEGKGKPEQLTGKESATRRRHSSSSIPAAPETAGEKHPSYKVVISPGYLQRKTLHLPVWFVKRFTKERAITVNLQVADRSWPVNLHSYPRSSYKFCGGFSAFLRENSLQAGDTCVFELTDKAGSIIKVSILRHGG